MQSCGCRHILPCMGQQQHQAAATQSSVLQSAQHRTMAGMCRHRCKHGQHLHLLQQQQQQQRTSGPYWSLWHVLPTTPRCVGCCCLGVFHVRCAVQAAGCVLLPTHAFTMLACCMKCRRCKRIHSWRQLLGVHLGCPVESTGQAAGNSLVHPLLVPFTGCLWPCGDRLHKIMYCSGSCLQQQSSQLHSAFAAADCASSFLCAGVPTGQGDALGAAFTHP